jgi:UDP-N-acetylglucosamine 2-epimerase (non-hydrolysing)
MKIILVVLGTRPEAIKLAPVIIRFREDANLQINVLSTGQHGVMLDEALEAFEIRVDYFMKTLSPGQTLSSLSTKLLTGASRIISKIAPDLVIVHGDTSSAFCAALAAYYLGVPVAHVEAGLRTHNKFEPFPEEFNRSAISRIATWHFAPTELAKDNLKKEGIDPKAIQVTGNTVVDSVDFVAKRFLTDMHWMRENVAKIRQEIFPFFMEKPFVVVTLHRRENAGKIFAGYLSVIRRVASRNQDFHFVFPVHPNPSISAPAREALSDLSNVHLSLPIDYLTFSNLLAKSSGIVTDSGGLQEEGVTFGKPVFLCRSSTERPEGVAAGKIQPIGQNYELLEKELELEIRKGKSGFDETELFLRGNPYGDGLASQKIFDFIKLNL